MFTGSSTDVTRAVVTGLICTGALLTLPTQRVTNPGPRANLWYFTGEGACFIFCTFTYYFTLTVQQFVYKAYD